MLLAEPLLQRITELHAEEDRLHAALLARGSGGKKIVLQLEIES